MMENRLMRSNAGMFGYVVPLMSELKVKEFQQFRACYCGMCHELKKSYGYFSRFILNYDFVFLAMLTSGIYGSPEYCMKRCESSPIHGRCVCCGDDRFSDCAGMSIILTWWKLDDAAKDSKSFAKKLGAKLGKYLLNGAYRKASCRLPEFSNNVSEELARLESIEKACVKSLDEAADCFASLLSSAADRENDEGRRRVLKHLLYHLGRVIYIADAWQDIAEDRKQGVYNPIVERFSINGTDISDSVRSSVSETLYGSVDQILSAFELLEKNYWNGILENIVYLGIPDMCGKVLAGTYKKSSGRVSPPDIRGYLNGGYR